MNISPLGDSSTQALRRFKVFKWLLWAKGTLTKFAEVIWEYCEIGHAGPVSKVEMDQDMDKLKVDRLEFIYLLQNFYILNAPE